MRMPPATRWPILDASDRAAVARVLDRGVLSGAAAPEMRALEAEFAATLGVRFCLATNSGTSALHLALAAAGVGPGDEVIIPALSFVATAQAVVHQGATPVFADIDPATYTMLPADAAARVTPRTRAIVPVHLHGLPADMEAIGAVAARAGLVVIEDAAQAHGARYRGAPAGALGAMAAFSLNSTKNLPAGEGGLFVTNDEDRYARAVRTRFNGLELPSKWDAVRPLDDEADGLATDTGFMYLPGELTCAIARSQLERLAQTTARSQRNAARLTERLGVLRGVEPPIVPSDRTHVFHKYRVRLDPRLAGLHVPPPVLRDHVLEALRAEGVEAVLWQTAPLPSHPRFARLERYARAEALVAGSIILGSQSYPLFAQPIEVVDAWADAFERVWRTLPF
ncbi:MAG: DegT/DnrJ/EryC1/StrS family aminotransferase [Candidatus Rokubacteria bacterium]|nr:DegT/DnrJ/EryC1/StrS family aminotransferase [Candidatus Rokubacteria bacterium]